MCCCPPTGRSRPTPGAAFATALGRAQRLVDDPAGAVWYGARRIFAFALMIRDGIPTDEIEPYLHARAWLADAARLLRRTPRGPRRRAGRHHARQRRHHPPQRAAARRRRTHPSRSRFAAGAVPPRLAASGTDNSGRGGTAVTPGRSTTTPRPG